jgi:membrane-associated phospholipid phosphatase
MQNGTDYIVLFIMAVLVIIGIYQFYFWCQRNNKRAPVELPCFVDNWFTLKPWWIWVYSGIYYPVIVFMIFSFRDMRHFNYTCISFFVLLLIQMIFFVYFPVKTPDSWRNLVPGNSITHRFMRYVQTLDQSNNCFPSMHISVSTLTSLHLMANIDGVGTWIFIFPILIGFSALYTKQHFFLDLLPGAVVGWFSYQVFVWMSV